MMVIFLRLSASNWLCLIFLYIVIYALFSTPFQIKVFFFRLFPKKLRYEEK